jgi:hypothetical protein
MTDAETTALIERARLSMRLVLIAASREVEAMRSGDHRYAKTADAIRRIAGTMDQVNNDVLLKLVTVNQLSEGLLSTLIATRLSEVGFALPHYKDALAFFEPIEAAVMRSCAARATTCTDHGPSAGHARATGHRGALTVVMRRTEIDVELRTAPSRSGEQKIVGG